MVPAVAICPFVACMLPLCFSILLVWCQYVSIEVYIYTAQMCPNADCLLICCRCCLCVQPECVSVHADRRKQIGDYSSPVLSSMPLQAWESDSSIEPKEF
uniref:Putative secreted protein n=1 Tax=Ixodes ricinus TaxID=34613 RepID=A0A147BF97_IXORI